MPGPPSRGTIGALGTSGIATRLPVASLVYEHTKIDLTAVVTFRVLASVTIQIGSAMVEEQHSDDDVTYSSWVSTGPQISGRYMKIRITVATPHVDGITQASLIIDAESVSETINDLATAPLSSPAGDFRLPITKNYTSIWMVNVAFQNAGSGWSWEIVARSGPESKFTMHPVAWPMPPLMLKLKEYRQWARGLQTT